MTEINWKKYGNGIADNECYAINGNVRDIDAIIEELRDIRENFSTHAMSDHVLWLKGKAEMLDEVISYLERV
jgi:hypothetical protein